MMAAALPRRVAWLGYGGLLPFIATTLGSAAANHHDALWLDIQHAYLPLRGRLTGIACVCMIISPSLSH